MLKRAISFASRTIQNRLKRIQLFPLGFRATNSATVYWSVSADGGGSGGRICIGRDTRIDIGVIIRAYGGLISIGNHCSVNPYCVIQGSGRISIGDGVRIASHTVIVASNHIFDMSTDPIYLQGVSAKGIIIEDNVWIGAGAKILDGVVLREGTVVGAGSVVNKSTEAYSVVVGIPARTIRVRG